jgi:hypothetical protein
MSNSTTAQLATMAATAAAHTALRDRKRRLNNLLNAACKRGDIVTARKWNAMLEAC